MKYRKVGAWLIAGILVLSLFGPFLVPEVKADSKASRTTVSKAGQIVTCYDDGGFLDDRGLATLGSSYRNIRTGLKFEGFTNISKTSRIDSAILRVYYYTGIDFNTTTEAQLLIEGIKDGAPEFLTWDGVVNGWDTDHITWFNMSWLNGSGYYDITLNPDMIQEIVLSSPWLHDNTPENGSIVLRTWNVAPVGPGFQRYHYEIPTGEPSLSNLRPTLTVTYTPGVYDSGYDVTPEGTAGTGPLQTLIQNGASNRIYMENGVLNTSTPTAFNETPSTLYSAAMDYGNSLIEQVGNITYVLGTDDAGAFQDIRIYNSSDGQTWDDFVIVEGNLTDTKNYAFAYDDTRQVFHVVYTKGYNTLYAKVYINGTVDPVTKGLNIMTGFANGQEDHFTYYDAVTGKTWFITYGGYSGDSTRRTLVTSLSAGGVWSDVWQDATTSFYGYFSKYDGELFMSNSKSSKMQIWRFNGSDAVQSWNLTGSGKAFSVAPLRLDAIGGVNNASIPVIVTSGMMNVGGNYKTVYSESYDFGVTWSAEFVVAFGTAFVDSALAVDLEGRIYSIQQYTPDESLYWGEYEDHVYHRGSLGVYDPAPGLYDDLGYVSVKREIGSSGATTNATWVPFEPDPPIPGFNETCIDRQLRINFGAGPYTEDQVIQAIDFCEDWIPGNETEPDDLTYAISKKSFKLYYLVIGTASIVIPWLLYAFSSDPEYIGWILILNALGMGLLIEFMRL